MSETDTPLTDLLAALRAEHYHFITPTPTTHVRVLARREAARNLRDVFGWSLPFQANLLPAPILAAMRAGNVLEETGPVLKSRVRVSCLDDMLLLHSAYPTTQREAVFFGPDSYRFAAFLQAEAARLGAPQHVVDIGAGAGVGGLVAGRLFRPARITLTDINPLALRYARINAACAGRAVETRLTDGLAGIDEPVDLIIANPPYIIDAARRAYRDGGGMHGAEISLAWAQAAAAKLTRGGALLLYTGSAIIGGEDRFKVALHETLSGFDIAYRELDPDVFGEELEREDYADVERIAVVGVVAMKR